MKAYEVCLKINGQKSVQRLDEERLLVWASPVTWQIAVDFAIELAREQIGLFSNEEPDIEFEYVKEYALVPELSVGYVYQPTPTLQ